MSARAWAARVLFPRRQDAVTAWLRRLVAGVPIEIAGVDLLPLSLSGVAGPPDLLSSEAIAAGVLDVAELPDARVALVSAVNRGEDPVLVLEGEILVGCWQNRVVARSVLIPPRSRCEIPVACVEQGRWSTAGARFCSGTFRAEPALRRQTLGSVDQGRVWRDVSSVMSRSGIRSRSHDYHMYLASRVVERSWDVARLPEIRDQVGLIATRRGRLLGIELVAHPSTFARLRDRTLPGYLSEARDDGWEEREGSGPDPGRWLDVLRGASVRSSPGVAAGRDLSMTGDGLVGRGLWGGGRLLYLAAFPA